MIKIGIIGYGQRLQHLVDRMQRLGAGTEITAIADLRNSDELGQDMSAIGLDPSGTAFYSDTDEMLDKEELDGVMIGTRDSTHSRLAIKVLNKNIHLFLEKPIATNMEDLIALRDAFLKSSSKVVVSFPLRVSQMVRLAKEIIDSGKIGTVEHVQAWNNVPYGWCYYQTWFRDWNETQGLFLQKTTHDFDYINYLVGVAPVSLCAVTSKRVYVGDHPAGLKCDDCQEWDSCLESPFHAYFTKQETDRVRPSGLMCGFAVDADTEDSSSAIVQYETGMHACYSQNFFARKKAAKRGATLLGYKGTIEFEWYNDEIKVFMHHTPRVESYKFETDPNTHWGGDNRLVDNFVRVIRGDEESASPMSAGLLSDLMCLKANVSAATKTFQQIEYFAESGV
jgi:predicted dehydrogenase